MLISLSRQLFPAETRSRETAPKLRFWDSGLFIISRTTLSSDVLLMKFKYYHIENTLLSVDYVRGLDSQVIPYNENNEDQNVQPEHVLNYAYRDELSLDCSVYKRHSTDHSLNCRDIDSPVKYMYALSLFARVSRSNAWILPKFGTLEWLFIRSQRSPLERPLDGYIPSGAC